MPAHFRGDWENYGQVESHVRQVYNDTIGWFGGDVYDINPLSEAEEARRTVEMMGGVSTVRKAAAEAARKGGLANWRRSLDLSHRCCCSLILRTPKHARSGQRHHGSSDSAPRLPMRSAFSLRRACRLKAR